MVAVRAVLLAFAVKLHVIVPESVPIAPAEIKSQLSPEVTVAAHGMAPTPVFETLNVVEPASLATARLTGLTEMTE